MNYFTLFIIAFIAGCKTNERYIRLGEFKQYSLNSRQTEVSLLRSYAIDNECNSKKGMFYANAFLCKVNDTNDTIIVFNICKKQPDFLDNGYTGYRWLMIDSSTADKVTNNAYDSVITNLGSSISASKYKALIGEISNVHD